MRRWPIIVEAAVVLGLGAAALWYGRFAFNQTLNPPDYYYLAPSVMVAAGHGFHLPVPAEGSPLAAFLSHRSLSLSLADATPAALAPPDAFAAATRYLLYALGYWWRITGISWERAADVAAAMHAVTVLGLYASLRLFVPVWAAALGGLWLCTSTLQLSFVPHIRDYSKAAFIVGSLPFIIAMAQRAATRSVLLAVSAGAGVLLGVGFGFRMDVAIMVPLALAALLVFRGRRPWTDLPAKLAAAAMFLVTMFVPAWPVVSQLASGGSNESHVVILGYASEFDVNLGIEPAPYTLVPFYSDTYVSTMVSAYGEAAAGEALTVPSPEYAAASRDMWLRIIRTLPGDVYARFVAAANGVMNLPFRQLDPPFAGRVPLQSIIEASNRALARFEGTGIFLGWALLASAAAAGIRQALFACLVLAVLAGYPSLQFSGRHFFHLQAVPIFAGLLLIAGAVGMAAARGRMAWRMDRAGVRRAVTAMATATILVVATTWLPLSVLRAAQLPAVRDLLESYGELHRIGLDVEQVAEADGSVLVRWPASEGTAARRVTSRQYALEFQTDESAGPIVAGLRFATADPGADFSRVIVMQPRPGMNTITFSALTIGGTSSFEGVELSAGAAVMLTGVYRVDAGRGARLALDAVLPAGWRETKLFQQIGRPAGGEGVTSLVCSTGPACRGLLGYLDRAGAIPPVTAASVTLHAPIASVSPFGVVVHGAAENDSAYFFQLNEGVTRHPGAFLARGTLSTGAVTIGLLKNTAWHQQAVVRKPGDFLFIAPLAAGGAYIPLVTNTGAAGSRAPHLTLTHAGFVERAP